MTAQELFRLVADAYEDQSDDFVLSLGHHEKPEPTRPISIFNLPEFKAYASLEMRQIREWAAAK